jgi:PAS domain S-box-containing protein
LRVLILEDSSTSAELMIDELRRAGFAPDWERVETREQYLAHLRLTLDVILANYALPRFDALEALRLLRQRELDVPFIVITDIAGQGTAVTCLREGAEDYVLRDRLTRLGPSVEQALEARRLRGERQAVERDAHVSARQWQATFDAISDPIFLLDAGGKITRCNEAAGGFAGEPLSALVGRPYWEVVHGTSEPIDGSPYRRALSTQRRESQVWQQRQRWFEAVVDPMLDDNGYLIGFVYLLEEITEQKRTEQALRQRNQELSLLNRAGRTLNTSLELEEVLGAVLEEVRGLLGVIGCSAWLQDPETDEVVCRQASGPQRKVAQGWRLAPGEGVVGWVVDHDESVIVPDAQRDERHFGGVDAETRLPIRSILCVPLRSQGKVVGALEAVDTEAGRFDSRDKRLLEALAAFAANAIQNARLYERAGAEIRQRERAEEAHRVVVEHALQGLVVVQDGRIAFANPRAAEITGYAVEELLALSPEQVGELIHQGDRRRLLDRLRRRLRGEFAPHRYSCRLVQKDGAVRWIELAANRIDYEGRPAVQTSFMDITERKRAQKS